MQSIRESIKEDTFPEFVRKFFNDLYPNGDFPTWAKNALEKVGIVLTN